MVFSRGRGRGRHAQDGPADLESREQEVVPEPMIGPYDVADAPSGVRRLDLGSLRIPAIEGVEVRVQANPEGVIQQVVLANRGSALQLGVFAAPRTDGIWDEVRAEISESLRRDGASVQETAGEYGPELRATVRTPDGGHTELRFVGVDGPRWMVRGLFQGPAAVDPAAAGPLADALRGLVVDRGQEAKPVREPLPLRLPKELAEQAGGATAAPARPAADTGPG
ncbi:DUF3710 domain-containing protein [Solwaraspora sp. WMMD406]|uniref:DUF3710 domain-containing protein n=1 Tax=Solwaraspora sp. WMMD406 TaxID=3016095 RepID=UPI0024168403|nr:DUF3710 domain-containing protein [Solwaraspora sp. WMMD406]MDG4767001.1 DUF3710 domain-containing protein [Solwaraspora sp. WMMD406]